MEIFELDEYKVHVTVKIPHLYENTPRFSYQFLIFDKKGKLMNYPFSVIVADNDEAFKKELKRYFKYYMGFTEVKAYPKSKFLEMLVNNNI
ncbi:MAG: hypothetical protein ACFFEY_11275 [Candidatus Thorarchaeota archaeon]